MYMMLRNVNRKRGWCNGTRAVYIGRHGRLLRLQILTGTHAGEEALLPRINLDSEQGVLPFTMRRGVRIAVGAKRLALAPILA